MGAINRIICLLVVPRKAIRNNELVFLVLISFNFVAVQRASVMNRDSF